MFLMVRTLAYIFLGRHNPAPSTHWHKASLSSKAGSQCHGQMLTLAWCFLRPGTAPCVLTKPCEANTVVPFADEEAEAWMV